MRIKYSIKSSNSQVNTGILDESHLEFEPGLVRPNEIDNHEKLVESERQDGSHSKLLNLARSTVKKLKLQRNLSSRREKARIVLSLLKSASRQTEIQEFREAISDLTKDEQHYWIGTLYTLLLSPRDRRNQAAYFTPPYLANAVLDLAIQAGFQLHQHRVLDPAAGGAAFLSTVAGRALEGGVLPSDILRRLRGIELDAGLAQISEALIADRLALAKRANVIRVQDALTIQTRSSYDLVIANPPYGRITAKDLPSENWKKVSYSGHINKYAVFSELCLRHAKKGGIVALVLPSSFRAGPFYDRIRSYIRSNAEILAVASVPEREGVFADVAQDVSVLILRKGSPHSRKALVPFPVIRRQQDTSKIEVRLLPKNLSASWPFPVDGDSHVGGAVLADYGATIRAGYFVWNREFDRLTTRSSKNAYPLVWAKNVRAEQMCWPMGKNGTKTDFVKFTSESTAIVRSHAAVLQRTTNDKQPRRIIASVVDPGVVEQWGGFVTENHTIVLTCERAEDLSLIVSLLNTKAVDDRYRRVSGTASVSVQLLRQIDLPQPDIFRRELVRHKGNAEAAAESAYATPEKITGDGYG